jgi:polar amino acid transport system substrate-binding protein
MKKATLAISILVVMSVLVSACAVPTPEVIEKEVVVTQEVEKEVVVTVEVEAAPPPVEEETYKLRTPGVLTVGYNQVPGIVVVEDGVAEGVFADITEEIANRLGLDIEWQVYDFPALFPALQSGRVDMITGLSQTQARSQIFYYVVAHFLQPEVIAVRPGSEFNSWEESAEKGETLSTLYGYFYIGIWEEMGINIHTFDTDEACYLDVLEGESEGCEVGAFGTLYKRATAPDSPAAQLQLNLVSGPRIVADLNANAVNKANPVLAREATAVLEDMWRDGFVEAAYAKVYGEEDAEFFLSPPEGHAFYIPGPWEKGVFPAPSAIYPEVSTVSPGELTIGVVSDSALLSVDGSGPEGEVLSFVAGKLGLEPTFVAVDDEAAALNDGTVDVIAGALVGTEEGSCQYWQSMPVGFNPDYIYVMPGEGGGYPDWTKWEDVTAEGGALAVVSGNPRIADLEASGADVLEVEDAVAGMRALMDGSALGFVGSSLDYLMAASSDPEIADAGIGFVRNINVYSIGESYIWGVKSGNGDLLDALNQGLNAAYQGDVVANAYQAAFPGANVSAALAPGPAAVGTAWGESKDFTMRSMWVTGPWLQRPGWCK